MTGVMPDVNNEIPFQQLFNTRQSSDLLSIMQIQHGKSNFSMPFWYTIAQSKPRASGNISNRVKTVRLENLVV